MTSDNLPRRLAAILYMDVAGYSRLTGEDEDSTHRRLSDYLDHISVSVDEHRGRVMHYAGDAVLAKFDAVVDAVTCAIEVQAALGERNADLPEHRRVEFRAGVNLGDVIEDRGDIYGDGVNVAARLETLAEPGGICVSDAVRTAIGNRIALGFEDLGEQEVKNISQPVRAYRARPGAAPVIEPVAAPVAAPLGPAGGAERPSIAVLPLANMSGDAEQEFFADGLTEDIITELSRFRDLIVISRNSTFVYKGEAIKVPEVARELGVRFVLEGSVRKSGNRVRVTVQLIDAQSDRHVWAERYDRELEDIFALQDEMTAAIVATLPGRIESAERERVGRKPTENMVAYEYVLAGKVHHHRFTRADNLEAQRLLDKAIALDPGYLHAHAWKACVLGQSWVRGWCESKEATWAAAVAETDVCLEIGGDDADVHRLLAAISLIRGNHERAAHHQRRGLDLNPNYDLLVVQRGELLTWLGRADEGVEWIRKAMRLNPHHPERFWSHLGRAHFTARRYAEAIEALKRISAPDDQALALMVACYVRMGDEASAAAHARRVLEANPGFTIAAYANTLHYAHEADRDHLLDALAKSDLPGGARA